MDEGAIEAIVLVTHSGSREPLLKNRQLRNSVKKN